MPLPLSAKQNIKNFLNGALPKGVKPYDDAPNLMKWSYTDPAGDTIVMTLHLSTGTWTLDFDGIELMDFSFEALEWMTLGARMAKDGSGK